MTQPNYQKAILYSNSANKYIIPYVPNATSNDVGLVKPDNSTIVVDQNGVISLGQGQGSSSDVFCATYGTTTYNDILSAYNSGKIIYTLYLNDIYYLSYVDLTNKYFYFDICRSSNTTDCTARGMYCRIYNGSTSWNYYSKTLQTKNLTTNLSPSSTDTQYPSAKCVFDKINEVADTKQDVLVSGNNVTISDITDPNNVVFDDYYSTDSSESFISICYGNGCYIAISEYGGFIKSTDGLNWTAYVDSGLFYNSWWDITYANSQYIMISFDGYITTSSDGTNWTTPVNKLGNATWRALYSDGTNLYALSRTGYVSSSTDGGSTWSSPVQNSDLGNNYWAKVAYGNGKFVAIGENGHISTSTDGTTWTTATD